MELTDHSLQVKEDDPPRLSLFFKPDGWNVADEMAPTWTRQGKYPWLVKKQDKRYLGP